MILNSAKIIFSPQLRPVIIALFDIQYFYKTCIQRENTKNRVFQKKKQFLAGFDTPHYFYMQIFSYQSFWKPHDNKLDIPFIVLFDFGRSFLVVIR